jgi:RHH-type rel operon transcriptional repressor/antitoxin RelB
MYYNEDIGGIMAISVRLDSELEARLEHLATVTGRAKSYYLRELIEMGLEELEDFYLADATIKGIRKGQEVVHSSNTESEDNGLDH